MGGLASPGVGRPAAGGAHLTGYSPWRKKNLKHFSRPDFGAVVVEHPRPLPIEPL